MMYQQSAQAEAARLEDYIRAVQLRKWLVIAFTALGLLLAFLFISQRTLTYTAEATVLVRPSPENSVNPGREAEANLERERAVVSSDATATAVADQLANNLTAGSLLSNLNVAFRPESDVLNIDYTWTNAKVAAEAANAFAETYVEGREGRAAGYYQGQLNAAIAQQDTINTSLADVNSEVAAKETERATTSSDSRRAELQSSINELDDEQANLNIQLRTINATISTYEQTIQSRLPAAEVLQTARPPKRPNGLSNTMILIAGLLIGGVFGVVIAFLLERLDTTARDDSAVAMALGTSVMGAIPRLGMAGRRSRGALVMLTSGGSPRVSVARESFRRLRSSIQFLNSSSGVNSLLVTSSSPGEGKSTTAANLSVALAQNGARTVLVSADLRRPSLEALFGMEADRPGLSEYLASTAELNAEKIPNIDNMWLIRSGAPPPNPGELLHSNRFEQMIRELEREGVEYIVVDTPPILSTADALSAARYVDGVLVVVDTERTETSDLFQVRAELERSGFRLLGAVLNRQSPRGGMFKRDKYTYHQR